jgi:hypothetical protein
LRAALILFAFPAAAPAMTFDFLPSAALRLRAAITLIEPLSRNNVAEPSLQ